MGSAINSSSERNQYNYDEININFDSQARPWPKLKSDVLLPFDPGDDTKFPKKNILLYLQNW